MFESRLLIYLFRAGMEVQANESSQNDSQIDNNLLNKGNEPVTPTIKSRINYLLILVIILFSSLVFGFGGYYLGRQSSKISNETKDKPQFSPAETIENKKEGFKAYSDAQQGVRFDYPSNYTITNNNKDCGFLTTKKEGCLLSLILNPLETEYIPKASFYLLDGIGFVSINGQISSVKFNLQKKAWVEVNQDQTETLAVWNYTSEGKEIFKVSVGGSHGSAFYYLIPDYENDKIAIFSFPESYRLRCDFLDDRTKEAECNNFYQSVIDQYNNGQEITDTWLPDNFLKSVYKDAEDIVKSLSFGTTFKK